MHSVADLTTFSRPTTGDVPPKLVVSLHTQALSQVIIHSITYQGASTTVVGDKMYIFVCFKYSISYARNDHANSLDN